MTRSMPPPQSAAWWHREAREGFEVVFVHADHDGYRLKGATAAVEDGEPWFVDHEITTGSGWVTRDAVLSGRSIYGALELDLEADGAGGWRINGLAAPHLDGCVDVDLESSAMTNALPVHRLGLAIGEGTDAAAAYVRAGGARSD